jgi:glyoxylase-like metal-dependent hydrolase (beta-lactamase superfamily II)
MTIGRLDEPSAVRSLQLDDVRATYVVDGVLLMNGAAFFPAIPDDYWAAHPELVTANGALPMGAGGLLVERGDTTLLIDAGVGATSVSFPIAEIDCGALIDVLAALDHTPDDIDVVAFTHLHFDHAGWAFVNGDKTFPNARYVLAEREWAPYTDPTRPNDATTPSHVIEAMAADPAALQLVQDGDEIIPGVRAVVTPGHTPGHTSYVVTSRTGQRLVAVGDAFHTPAQLAHPEWMSVADSDVVGVETARRRLLEELAEPDTIGFGFHFGDQAFGRTAVDMNGETIWEPVPTPVLAPTPRLSR